jgi:hypothetical protein
LNDFYKEIAGMRYFTFLLFLSCAISCGAARSQPFRPPETCSQFDALPVVEDLPGPSEFTLVAKFRSGRTVALEVGVVKGYSDRVTQRKAIAALETHVRDGIRCAGLKEIRSRVRMGPGESSYLELVPVNE